MSAPHSEPADPPEGPTALSSRDRKLLGEAVAARRNAHAPYSGFPVGAALRGRSGRVHRGCNVENASYPAGICAEGAAVVSAVAAGETDFVELAVVTGASEVAAPCGICRQTLAEFAADLRIVLASVRDADRADTGAAAAEPTVVDVVFTSLDELLPRRFGAAQLRA